MNPLLFLIYVFFFFVFVNSFLSRIYKRRGQSLTLFFVFVVPLLPFFYLVFGYRFLDFLLTSFFLLIISSRPPHSSNSYISPLFNVSHQRSSMPHRLCHLFNVACLVLRPNVFSLILASLSNHVSAMIASDDKLLLSCYTSPFYLHQRCYIAVNFNAPLHVVFFNCPTFIHMSCRST